MRTILIASWKFGKRAVPIAIIAVLALSLIAASNNIVWLQAGQGRANWHSQPLETTISRMSRTLRSNGTMRVVMFQQPLPFRMG